MLQERVLLYGKDEALPERRELRTGPLSMIWEEGDLRYIRLGEREVLRRIYVAVRDRNWGTAPNLISNLLMDVGDDCFRIAYEVDSRLDEIDFAWRGEIEGDSDGTLRFVMDGIARTSFLKNRIGFCILHPDDVAGANAEVEHVDGTRETAALPVLFTPDQPVEPFAEMRRLSHEVQPGIWAELLMEGDIFEMEDQRNWTDASYKTFSTPLRIPYPAQVEAGARIRQALTLRIRRIGEAEALLRPPALAAGPSPVTYTLDLSAATLPMPRLGLGVASDGEPLTANEIKRLKLLRLNHLRVDLPLGDPEYVQRLRLADHEAMQTGAELEAALFLDAERAATEIESLAAVLDELRPRVARWLVFPVREQFAGGTPLRAVLAAARPVLRRYADAPVYSGTNADFIFLARNRPPLDLVDGITFSITPQVHAFDNSSIVETLSAQGQAVASARALANGKPVIVSPITLKMRHNPYATAAIPPPAAGQLPAQVDPRQMSLFAAGWTVASLKRVAEAGAASATYFETAGWRGVMERVSGSAVPDKFISLPGSVFPVYFALADVAGFSSVIPSRSSDRLVVDGLALTDGRSARVMLANLTPAPHTVVLSGLTGPVAARMLDASNAERAMLDPDAYLSAPPRALASENAEVRITLPAFAIACIDGPIIRSA